MTATSLLKSNGASTTLANHYWKHWLREYIPSLQERQKWQKAQRNLYIGELVLIANDNVPQHQWSVGLVINVFSGPNRLVRSEEVRAKGSTYRRPITKICLLEESDSGEAQWPESQWDKHDWLWTCPLTCCYLLLNIFDQTFLIDKELTLYHVVTFCWTFSFKKKKKKECLVLVLGGLCLP